MKIIHLKKVNEKSIWDTLKEIVKFKDKSEIDYIKGEYLFDEDCDTENYNALSSFDCYKKSYFGNDINEFVKITKKYGEITNVKNNYVFNADLKIIFKNGNWLEFDYEPEWDIFHFVLREKPLK